MNAQTTHTVQYSVQYVNSASVSDTVEAGPKMTATHAFCLLFDHIGYTSLNGTTADNDAHNLTQHCNPRCDRLHPLVLTS